MKFLFALLLLLHSLIHLLGFVKAFKPEYISQISKNISKPEGGIWALACVLLLAGFVLYLQKNDLWPAIVIGGVILSQVLINLHWDDARFGTLANLIILGVALSAQGSFSFKQKTFNEISTVIHQRERFEKIKDPASLPPPVQKWLTVSGAINRTNIPIVHLTQKGELRIKPKGKWMPFQAEQYFNTVNPAFLWSSRVTALPFIYLDGRDKLLDGKGEMKIKLESLLNIVNEKENHKIDSGSKIRFLGELCWFPFAAREPYIKWIPINNSSVKAIFHQAESPVEGLFEFSADGSLRSFEAQRFYGGEKESQKHTWRIDVLESATFDGLTVPSKCKVIWKLPKGDFHWLTLHVTGIDYNPDLNSHFKIRPSSI